MVDGGYVTKRAETETGRASQNEDHLFVNSVEKAFRVLEAFDERRSTMTLTEIADATGLDKSAAQRFAHTLERLGFLSRNQRTKELALSVKTLTLGYRYISANSLVQRAAPYLMHLSKETEEAVNLTVLDDGEIVFVSRLLSRHMLNTNIIVGTRLPAYCTAPGLAMLSQLPRERAREILEKSDLRPYTPHTIWRMKDILQALDLCATRGYAIAVEQVYPNDISISSAILDESGLPIAAVNIAVMTVRYSRAEAERKLAPLVLAASQALSHSPINKQQIAPTEKASHRRGANNNGDLSPRKKRN